MLVMEEIRPNKILDLLLHMQQLIASVSFTLFVELSKDTSCGWFLFFPSLLRSQNKYLQAWLGNPLSSLEMRLVLVWVIFSQIS
jgi:hypothetical protein